VSHWRSGLPKLDLEPFDPTPLWDAAESTHAEQRGVAADRRRRRMVPFIGALAVVAATLAGVLVLLR
jgi:hypothetical protein